MKSALYLIDSDRGAPLPSIGLAGYVKMELEALRNKPDLQVDEEQPQNKAIRRLLWL